MANPYNLPDTAIGILAHRRREIDKIIEGRIEAINDLQTDIETMKAELRKSQTEWLELNEVIGDGLAMRRLEPGAMVFP